MSGRWEWWFYILYVGLVCVWEVGVVVLHTVCRSGVCLGGGSGGFTYCM